MRHETLFRYALVAELLVSSCKEGIEVQRPGFTARTGPFCLANLGAYFLELATILGKLGQKLCNGRLSPTVVQPPAKILIEELGIGERSC